MKHGRFRVPFVVLFVIFFLALALEPVPSERAAADLRPAGSDLRASLHGIADWMAGSRFGAGGLRVLRPSDLAAAASPQPRQFEIFPAAVSAERQRRFLHDVPYGRAMSAAAERHRVDALLVAAIVEAESGFDPGRISPRGAVGLMQVLPSTAGDLGAPAAKALLDPRVNLDVGSRYLGQLIEDFSGDLTLAVAAYNAGPGAVERYRGVPPYPETQEYVKRVLALYDEHNQTMGVTRDAFSPPPYSLGR